MTLLRHHCTECKLQNDNSWLLFFLSIADCFNHEADSKRWAKLPIQLKYCKSPGVHTFENKIIWRAFENWLGLSNPIVNLSSISKNWPPWIIWKETPLTNYLPTDYCRPNLIIILWTKWTNWCKWCQLTNLEFKNIQNFPSLSNYRKGKQ